MRIRGVVDADADQVIDLVRCCYAEFEGVVFDLDGELPELRALATWAESRDGMFWVAEIDDEIIGSIALVPAAEPGGVELQRLYVRSTIRGGGIGTRLCGLVETQAREQGATFIHLWSDTRFEAAHRLYERLGYIRGPETRDLNDKSNSTEYYYRKALVQSSAAMKLQAGL